jgi:hypothetical protein
VTQQRSVGTVCAAVVTCLHAHPNDVALQRSGLYAVCNIATGDRAAGAAAGAAAAATRALMRHGVDDASVASMACETLHLFTNSAGEPGIIEAVAAVMRAHVADAGVLAASVRAMGRLCDEGDATRTIVLRSGALPALVAAMRAHGSAPELLGTCCGMLTVVCCGESSGRAAARRAAARRLHPQSVYP